VGLFGGGDDLASVADAIFGASEAPDVGRVVARPTPILSIWADVKQPRRAIPLSIRMHWDGNPLDVAALLEQWATVAANQAGVTIDLEALLNGEGEGIDTDKFPSVAQDFIALVRLAAGIKADGLINPITVIESDSKLLIESGERRWLAYHLLYMVMGETFTKIPAAKGNGNDSVWRQATENTQRRSLNAIGMARQIALLIMAARTVPTPNPSPLHGEGNGYKEYDEVIGAGVCDRRFYAQVADGNVHRIPKGMGERIQAAAEKFTRKTLGDACAMPARGEPAEGYSTMFANRANVEVLLRACRRVNNISIGFFPNAEAIAKTLTIDEIDTLMAAYELVRYELGPIVKTMTKVEYDAWIEVLGKGASSVPLAPMTSGLLNLLLVRMAHDLWTLRMDNSSLGEPQGCDT
jgi:hypothetical protein